MAFREALLAVPPRERDAWVDRELGLPEIPADGPDLPRAGVPYIPCAADVLLHVVEHVTAADVFVDIGSGVGRATALVHMLTGARAIGLEIQPALVAASRDLAERVAGIEVVAGDAAETIHAMTAGTVFFLYCPFGGERLHRVFAGLEAIAAMHPIRVCCLDITPPNCPWLVQIAEPVPSLTIYRAP